MPKIDVTRKAHEFLRSYCKDQDLKVKDVASSLILRQVRLKAVTTKKLERLPDRKIHSVWTKPPFWAKS